MFKKIKVRFMNLNVKRKLILLCVSLITLSSLLSSSAVYLYTSRMIKNSSGRYVYEVMQQSAGYLNEELSNILSKIISLQLDTDFINTMKQLLYEDKQSYAVESSRIPSKLSQIKSSDELISSIYIHTDKYYFYNFNSMLDEYSDFSATQIYSEIERKKMIYWGTVMQDEMFRSNKKVVPIAMPICVANEEFNGHIIINLDAEILRQRLVSISNNLNAILYIVNHNGEVVISDSNDPQRQHKIMEVLAGDNVQKWQINSKPININDWAIVCMQENSVLLRDVRTVQSLMLIITMFCTLLFSLLAVMLSNSITSPLKKLKQMMTHSIDNNFSVHFKTKYNDEIGQLANVFNNMCDRIRLLVSEVKSEQEMKRIAELRALNAQINPHFLYNTFDCVYWLSMKNGNKLVADIALAISNLFRFGLNKGKEITTLGNELQHAESYLQIQKIIYKEKFDYEIHYEKDILSYPIIKILLQPLVENSILHGFEKMHSGGLIRIDIFSKNSLIILRVSDNGCGMGQDEIDKVLNVEYKKGYGLVNIVQRLYLTYKDNASLEIYQNNYTDKRFVVEVKIKMEGDMAFCTR